MSDLELWYTRPAAQWVEALPVGNGRLGAMVFGGLRRERLQLNEDTLWAGSPYSPANPEARGALARVRELIFAGQYAEAEELVNRYLMAWPLKQMSYQPAADFWIEQDVVGTPEKYRRSLDLDTAVARTEFALGGVTFTREVIASAAAGVIAVRMAADRPGSVSFAVSLTSPQAGAAEPARDGELLWRGRNGPAEGIPGGLTFAVSARVRASGGFVRTSGPGVSIERADEAVIIIDAATSFRRFDDVSGNPDQALAARRAAVDGLSWDEIKLAHITAHRRQFRRLAIDLGPNANPKLPTDKRVAANPAKPDPSLAALYLQYGRYLMIASSQPGTQAANLQGIWNGETDPPGGSRHAANINLQMNYWLPDAANLGECMEPLLRLAEEVSVTGAAIASTHYGAGGWVLHHITDIWRAAAPADGARWGLWPTGGAWLCVQLWDHAVYVGRPKALVQRLYPLIAGAARFILDTMVQVPDTDWLVTSPSLSPENVHPRGASICAGPAMDRQIIRDLIDALLAAAGQLHVTDPILEEARRARLRIPADRIGTAGQLQEWLEDWDMQAPEMAHPHVSHLYGLYPGRQISPDLTPELAAAARRSLELRGDSATNWGIGWRINLWARLRDGDRAHEALRLLLSPERTCPNLFGAHPQLQIAGNFGGAAGIIEMLVQSDEGGVHLLPALPSAWPDGSIRGVRARGGLELDIAWANGRLTGARIMSDARRTARVHYEGRNVVARLEPGQPWGYPLERAL